jgi:hypothetical protein
MRVRARKGMRPWLWIVVVTRGARRTRKMRMTRKGP